ncbi:MAG: DUF975 family protein [Clostridia bacterium]|nr:DUF975 family protein [Clostridia bacterium]
MSSRAELRARARETLGGGIFKNPWLAILLLFLVVGALLSFAGSFVVLPIIIMGPVYIGAFTYLIKYVRKENELSNLNPVLEGFTKDVAGNIILGVLHTLFIFLWSLLLFIPGIIKSYSYAMAYYIKIDNPNLSANDAITESRKMMNGHKARLFLLDLSFIGWIIVGILALGIGVLWVEAYMQTTRVHFYEELKAKAVAAAEQPATEE